MKNSSELTSVEICAGAGGQALGLEQAGFDHIALIENDSAACSTLRHNRKNWNVIEQDLRDVSLSHMQGKVDLLAGGVPCPPFSIASKQLGKDDERDLFPTAIRLVQECDPKAVMLENVRGLSGPKFSGYREWILKELAKSGYRASWKLLYSSDYGVPQLRPRFILVALKEEYSSFFNWGQAQNDAPTVGETLYDLMASEGWEGVENWKKKANGIAPTIVGGSKKHGGADLGPTRAKQQWLELGVDGKGVANAAPSQEMPLDHIPRLTNRMVARIQGFPDDWEFQGSKTSMYRQIGNAFPPPVATNIGYSIKKALQKTTPEDHALQPGLFVL